MMTAAADAGVKHIIFGASWTVNAAKRLPGLSSRFAPGEALLMSLQKSHGLTWSVLRGGYFYSNYAEMRRVGSSGQADEFRFADFCVPANDPDDIGRVAAAIALVGGRGHEGKYYEISGPERLWMGDVAKAFFDILGRPTELVEMRGEDCLDTLPGFLKEAYEFMIEVGRDAVPFSADLEKVTGKKAVSLREWLQLHKDKLAVS